MCSKILKTYSILLELLARGKLSRRWIAEKFELNERTISRYMDALINAGLPIKSATGRYGGYFVDEEYALGKSFLSRAEYGRIKLALEKTKGEFSDDINLEIIKKLEPGE